MLAASALLYRCLTNRFTTPAPDVAAGLQRNRSADDQPPARRWLARGLAPKRWSPRPVYVAPGSSGSQCFSEGECGCNVGVTRPEVTLTAELALGWLADDFAPLVDDTECALLNAAPTCPDCGEIARPNIIMFGDFTWHEWRAANQEAQLRRWLDDVSRLVVEIGAGLAIPSVRNFSHELVIELGARLIRINPRDPAVPSTHDVSIAAPVIPSCGRIARHFRQRHRVVEVVARAAAQSRVRPSNSDWSMGVVTWPWAGQPGICSSLWASHPLSSAMAGFAPA